ncbi:hypothetical protein [Streptomyces sp.]|uniref:hypothetical protein n=1 Tax=Streptomyces sp. TaxID=1931 RepID=UPI002F3E2D49
MTVTSTELPLFPFAGRMRRRAGFTIAADGSYAACLAEGGPAGEAATGPGGGPWFVERWTLGGPEPYAVGLPGTRPEEPGTRVVPMPDGRVLVGRRVGDRHDLVLLYPTGPGTGEVPVCSLPGADVRLLPPAPAPGAAYALAYGGGTTAVWQIQGTSARCLTTVEGRCTGGVWLDRTGRHLALDRELDGLTKAVAVDLHTGTVSPLLHLTDDSDDRLLLAEPGSGLLLLRSDAAGEARLGWGVLGSRRPVRFPDALRLNGALLTPVAAQPGHILTPETCVVALRAEAPGGAESLALWRPGERRLHWRASPPGWLGATGLWLPGAPLRLPYAVLDWPCGLMPYDVPGAVTRPGAVAGAAPGTSPPAVAGAGPAVFTGTGPAAEPRPRTRRRIAGGPHPVQSAAARPPAVLPLQQAPLAAVRAG